jgi:hypothetical protein
MEAQDLDLPLSKKITNLLGGRIKVKSTVGQGSVFLNLLFKADDNHDLNKARKEHMTCTLKNTKNSIVEDTTN